MTAGNLPNKPAEEKPEFQLHRSEPTPAEGPPVGMIVAVVVVLALGGLGFFLFGRGDSGGSDGKTKTVDAGGPKLENVEVPAAILERLDFKEGENVQDALDFAEEQLEKYPSDELRGRIARYRKELGLGLSSRQLLEKAAQLMNGKSFKEALEHLDKVIENEDDNSQAENAQAYYLRGACKANTGDKPAAVEDLKAAKEAGYKPAAKIDQLIKKLGG